MELNLLNVGKTNRRIGDGLPDFKYQPIVSRATGRINRQPRRLRSSHRISVFSKEPNSQSGRFGKRPMTALPTVKLHGTCRISEMALWSFIRQRQFLSSRT